MGTALNIGLQAAAGQGGVALERGRTAWCLHARMTPLPSPPSLLRLSLRALGAAAVLGSCAPVGPPQVFRFASNRDSTAAARCASDRLRIEGFEVADSGGAPLAMRRAESASEVGAPEWWRVQVSITRDDEGRTIVESLAGVGDRPEGPFREPNVQLQGIVGKISASCTW
jgi:hypothetical protein